MLELLSKKDMQKLEDLNNPKVMDYLKEAIELCKPAKVTVISDAQEDIDYVRELAVKNGEEKKLNKEGHTYHFDSKFDQARDKAHTKYLLSNDVDWGFNTNSINKAEGVKEVTGFMDGIMEGKEMLVSFFSLGPTNSVFSLRAMQVTDSSYVTHSEMILYRPGYEEFKRLDGSPDFFFFMHSQGELINGVTKNIDQRRIYIDLEDNRVYTCNNQYAGNSVGLKKLAFRLAIQKAQNEDWLAEHMFLMGVHGKEDRITYFAGAFPSACGKTSTAMIPGESIVGDDIAYLRNIGGQTMAVNVEQGIFGIIADVNGKDDPLIYNAITTPREVIFSNILINDGTPYWLGMGEETPKTGVNYYGEWTEGMKDDQGNEVKLAHKNARYTIRISELENADEKVNAPEGCPVEGIVYGGRDSDTTVPVAESLSWNHGVMLGSTIESETTAATLGAEGVRVHNPFANLDFISVPLAKYVQNHITFGEKVDKAPSVFTTNYFLRNAEGQFCNGKLDKKVWIRWADRRVNGEAEAIETPIGNIPMYDDLKALFAEIFDKDYTVEEYNEQFSIRVDKYLEKMDRMKKAFANIDMPEAFDAEMSAQEERLKAAKEKFGAVITPDKF